MFDEETGAYYLKSRYYLADRCRFVNADLLLGRCRILSHNLFAYCSNRVVCFADALGLEEVRYYQYVRCAPNEGITLTNGTIVYRGDVIISKSSLGDNEYSFITLEDGRKGVISNDNITSIKPWGIADVYGDPEMGPGKELNVEHVRNLQRDLAGLGYYSGPINGQYGKGTVAAVIAFGKVQGLGTGKYAGPKVKKRLFEKVYMHYDNMQDKMTQAYWNGYNDGRHN